MNYQTILESIAPFIPNSAGDENEKFNLALRGNKTFIPSILDIANIFGHQVNDVVDIDMVKSESSDELKNLFNLYGSDKANSHDYHIVYANILKNRDKIEKVVEIGLGTNNVNVLSNMGMFGKPGASLRAFRDYLPNALIYGGDVDRQILFTEDKIQTYFIDQLRVSTVEQFFNNFDQVDLIVDDGLHNPEANINVLKFALSKLKIGGWFVVEDIPDPSIDVWKLISILIDKNIYQVQLIKANKGNLFVVNKIL